MPQKKTEKENNHFHFSKFKKKYPGIHRNYCSFKIIPRIEGVIKPED
jgi:hypothetical protein